MRLILVFGFALLVSWEASNADAREATVEVLSGRIFQGEVLQQTDTEELWLRTQKAGVSLARPLRWHRIVSVTIGNEQLSPKAFRQRIASPEWHWSESQNHTRRKAWRASRGRLEIGPSPESPAEPELSDSLAADATADLRIASIRVDATVNNWNFDAAVDGIRLRVVALNQFGEAVPARGTLQAELIGQGPTNGVNGNPFPVLDQWSAIINADVTAGNQAELRLPFRGVHPEFSIATHMGSYGMIHAKLSVAGQGTFENTAAFTRIRPYSPVRDRLEQFYGRRFHPLETASPQAW